MNSPPALQASETPYENPPPSNPCLSGMALSVLASAVSNIGPVQGILWNNAGFGALRALEDTGVFDQHAVRFDPTFLPESSSPTVQTAALSLPEASSESGPFFSAAHFVAAYKKGTTTPTAVAERILEFISSPPNSAMFIRPTPREELLAAAAASTARYTAGNPLPLDGVPLAVKDEIDIAGTPKTMGLSPAAFKARLGGRPSSYTTACIQPLLDAGMLLLGKANMHEIGFDTLNNNPHYGIPPNAYNAGYYPGGSSGGSGASVGAGICPIAVGADGGGSIRIPATYNGVYGIKPSHGRIAIAPTVSIAPSVGVLGPIAATMSDLEISYRLMASTVPPSSPSSAPKVLGIYKPWFDDCDPAVHALVSSAVETFRVKLGYSVVDITIPFLAEGRTAHAITIMSEIGQGFMRSDCTGLSAPNKILVSVSSKTGVRDLLVAQKLRSLMMSHLAYLWKKHPGMIVVSPVTPHTGVKIEQSHKSVGVSDSNTSLRSMQYVFLANFIGTPAISIPVGYAESDGMPVGLMGMGEWGKEEELLEFGTLWEKNWDARKVGPGWIDVLKAE